jgi:nitroimidazol reductase NimA-like FMN-containing flavoprotein (pyridoxamine 5'-phosphate oxidase superfamily)
MRTIDDRTGLEELDEKECLLLLGRHTTGRLAVVHEGRPVMFPVSFRRDGSTIVFRSDEGTKLEAIDRDDAVAFEVDDLDDRARSGWSVVVTGRAAEVTDPLELESVRRLRLEPWAPGAKARYVRITPDSIEGRRIVRITDVMYGR